MIELIDSNGCGGWETLWTRPEAVGPVFHMEQAPGEYPVGTVAAYCVQCTERTTGVVGDFVYHPSNPMVAISPIFQSLADLYPWMAKNGWVHIPGTNFECRRVAT